MSEWSDDLALCLELMLEPGELFDLERACRAEPVLRRLYPRFNGSLPAKLADALDALEARGWLQGLVAGEVYRWLGRPGAARAAGRARARQASSARQARSEATPRASAPEQAAALGVAPTAPPVAAAAAPAVARTSAPAVAPPDADAFARELTARFAAAAAAGKGQLHVSAFDLHRAIAPYPAPTHRMRLCCEVMRSAMQPGDVALSQAEKDGPELLIRYQLPRGG